MILVPSKLNRTEWGEPESPVTNEYNCFPVLMSQMPTLLECARSTLSPSGLKAATYDADSGQENTFIILPVSRSNNFDGVEYVATTANLSSGLIAICPA